MGKYRWRTNLRQHLPLRPPPYRLVSKGPECGEHEWYRSKGTTLHCYHCRLVGDGG